MFTLPQCHAWISEVANERKCFIRKWLETLDFIYPPKKRGEENHFREKRQRKTGSFLEEDETIGLVYRVGRKKDTHVFGWSCVVEGKVEG